MFQIKSYICLDFDLFTKLSCKVDFENNDRRSDTVYSKRLRAGRRRTYFFDVRKTKGNDYYVTLTESTRRFDREGFERHKIFLYKEDFNRFLQGLEEAINYVKTELMPDYDYDEFTRRQQEWEAQRAAEAAAEAAATEEIEPAEDAAAEEATAEDPSEDAATEEGEENDPPIQSEDDMSW